MLSRHDQDIKDIIGDITNDVMVANIDNDRKGDANIAVYTLEETREEMKEKVTAMASAGMVGPRHEGGRAQHF